MVYVSDEGDVIVNVHPGLGSWDVYYPYTHSKTNKLDFSVMKALKDSLKDRTDVVVDRSVEYHYDYDLDVVTAVYVKHPKYKMTLLNNGKLWFWKR